KSARCRPPASLWRPTPPRRCRTTHSSLISSRCSSRPGPCMARNADGGSPARRTAALSAATMRRRTLGDGLGRAGPAAVVEQLPRLRRDWRLDFVVVNAENASSGAGLAAAHAKTLLEAGADCVTLGDHAFDQREMLSFIEQEPRVLRPLNFARVAPGKGAWMFEAAGGRKVFVAQVLGQVFMKRPFDDPFSAIDAAL